MTIYKPCLISMFWGILVNLIYLIPLLSSKQYNISKFIETCFIARLWSTLVKVPCTLQNNGLPVIFLVLSCEN